jgi:hypothetical protein
MSGDVRDAFQTTVHEGETRLTRTWPSLLATGAVGGTAFVTELRLVQVGAGAIKGERAQSAQTARRWGDAPADDEPSPAVGRVDQRRADEPRGVRPAR